MSRVPPQSEGFILAAQIDYQFLEPLWQAAAVKLRSRISLDEIAKRRSGTRDALEGLNAVELPNDTYVVQLDRQTLAAMGPANRQMTLKWVREVKAGAKVSSYLEQAAGYSDEAGSEVILALDMEGAFAPAAIAEYLDSKQKLLEKADLQEITRLLASVRGVRLGIRIGDKAFAKLAVDVESDVTLPPELCRTLLLEIMADAGLKIDEVDDWKPACKGKEFSLSGELSESGLRRIFSLVNSPLPTEQGEEETPDNTPKDKKTQMAEASKQQFDSITKMFTDLKQDWRDIKSISSAKIYFDRYARRIEKMPVLNIDPDMLKYRDFVAAQLRAAAESNRTMGIRSSYRQSQVRNSGGGGDYGGYYDGYRTGWYGGYGGVGGVAANAAAATNAFYANTRANLAAERSVRHEETAIMATDIQSLRANVIDGTNQIRRMMTERYQIEF